MNQDALYSSFCRAYRLINKIEVSFSGLAGVSSIQVCLALTTNIWFSCPINLIQKPDEGLRFYFRQALANWFANEIGSAVSTRDADVIIINVAPAMLRAVH